MSARQREQAAKAENDKTAGQTNEPYLQCRVTPRYLLVLALALPLVIRRSLHRKVLQFGSSNHVDPGSSFPVDGDCPGHHTSLCL